MPDISECVNKANEYLPIFSALGGACVAGAIVYINNLATIKSSERKHNRELMLNTAFESWKQSTDIAIAKMNAGHSAKTLPLDSHIISLLVFSESFTGKNITKDNVLESLNKVSEINDAVSKYHIDKHNNR